MVATDSEASAPQTCPFCRSQHVATTSKSVNADAYWRCHTCGQIWNPSRLKVVFVRP
jgi:transposase-like protein